MELVFLNDPGYPQLLLEGNDPPTLLYRKGTADLNARRMVAVVGTRRCSDYGRQQTEKLIRELANEHVTIVSGMAYGIDGVAHKTALEVGLPTIGVMAHGLHTVYPAQHYSLSKDIIRHNGALISEFHPGEGPEMHHFPVRNRIVAGISKAAIVVETRVDGGSMGTAKFAVDYHRDVFAFPGKVTDIRSSGCNLLINKLKASLITGADSFIEAMRWQDERPPEKQNVQLPLFSEMDPDTTTIVNLLGIHGTLPIDELYLRSGLTATKVATIVLQLELTGMLKCLPGKRYRLH
jgi:DNA processing protein